MAATTKVTKTEIIVHDLHVQEAVKDLPDNVFPISMKVTMDRKTREDVKHPEVREPDYPITARRADPTPYVPTKQVYFFNPAEISNQPGKSGTGKTWEYHAFADKLHDARAELELEDSTISERMYIAGAAVVEIPEQYVRYEDSDGEEVSREKVEEYREDLGHTPYHINPRASPDLYKSRAEMVIARFGKRQAIKSKQAQEKLQEALPGNVIKPLKLTEMAKVNAKQHRGSYNTTAAATKRMYFSTSQALDYSDPDLKPRYWMSKEDIDDDSPDIEHQLAIVQDEFAEHMPSFASTDFVSMWDFEGHMDDREVFVDENARKREMSS